jgi:Fe-S-cluster-containing hydrogenase component 2
MRTYSQEDINEQYEHEIEPVYCPHCLDRGYKVLLGPRILQPNEPRPADYENWIQCPTCLWICPLHEIAHEEEIKDTMETIDNPFEQGKFILETVYKRNNPKGKKLSAKKRRNKIKLDDDPEIDALLRAYGDNVKVHQ